MAGFWDEQENELFSTKKKKDVPVASKFWDEQENELFNPKPKAGLKEDEMLDKIVTRFKSSKKKLNELGFNYPGKLEPNTETSPEYEKGYEEGFRAALEAIAGKLGIDPQLFNA